jgi:hypothetical protein
MNSDSIQVTSFLFSSKYGSHVLGMFRGKLPVHYVNRPTWVLCRITRRWSPTLRSHMSNALGIAVTCPYRLPKYATVDNHSHDVRNITWRMASSGMLRRVALVRTDVSEELSASFIRVTRIGELGMLAVTSNRRALRRNTKDSSWYFFAACGRRSAYSHRSGSFRYLFIVYYFSTI